MQKTFDAVYKSGVLRPLEQLPLAEQQRVSLTIEEPPVDSNADEVQAALARISDLGQPYTFIDSKRAVASFLSGDPTLFPLLSEALRPLRKVFGDNRILQVRIQNSDDDRLLRVTAQLPADFQNPESALEAFDQDWWLNNCHRSDGGLVFDYEIQDAV